MSEFIKKIFKRDEEEVEQVIPMEANGVKLEIVDTMHQTMALTVSSIAKTYPKQYDMLKVILTEYAFFIETILVYRKSGNCAEMFMKLQEFMIRSIKGYLTKYEGTNDIIDEEKDVIKHVLSGLATIQDQVLQYEGYSDDEEVIESSPITSESKKPLEDWSGKPRITKRGGLPSLDAPITVIKGIGEDTAKKLEDIGVKTVADYIDYQRGQSESDEDEEDIDDELDE